MYYANSRIVKALAEERLHQMSAHRTTGDDAGERDGLVSRLRDRAGHVLFVAGKMVVRGVGHRGGHTATRGAHRERPVD